MNTSGCTEQEFMALWTANARAVFAYILTLEPNWIDAEDVLQETSVILWEKRQDFTIASNFRAWACKIAHFKLLEHLRRKRALTTADETMLDNLGVAIDARADALESRFEALAHCMTKLSPQDRELLGMRYSSEGAIKHMAARLGRNAIGLYRSLRRIHEKLFECIQRRISEEGS